MYYFVEVKYRSSLLQGGGLAAITEAKLRQMSFAAELYAVRHKQAQYMQLMAAEVNRAGNVELIEIT